MFEILLKPEIYSTWDNYSLAFTYLIISKTINISKYNNNTINKCIELWKNIVSSLPNERKNVNSTLIEIDSII